MKQLRGTGVALITPFTETGNIDFRSLGKIIDFNLRGRVNYFVVLGTTGENATLSSEEKKSVFDFVRKKVRGRVPLVAGIGGNNTGRVITELLDFNSAGYSAILSVSPYYNKPGQEGLFQHFLAVANAAPLPLIIYNVPGRTAMNISADTTLRLAAASKKIIGIKEASGNFSQIMHIAKNRKKGFLLLSGDDAITLPMLSLGVDGVISVAAQCMPATFSKMVDMALNGNFVKAAAFHFRMLEVMELIFEEGSPGGIKSALHSLGLCANILRLPLCPVSQKLQEKISAALQKPGR